jgi:hypothetical protein
MPNVRALYTQNAPGARLFFCAPYRPASAFKSRIKRSKAFRYES